MFQDSGAGASAEQVIFAAPVASWYALELVFTIETENGSFNFTGNTGRTGPGAQPGDYPYRWLAFLDEGEEIEFGFTIPNPEPPNVPSAAEWSFSLEARPLGLGPDLA
jgi:hypothetical protein